MNTFSYLVSGLSSALMLNNILAALAGGIIGLIVGALPGLGSVTGVALLLPLTFKMHPSTAIILLAAIYYSNMYGGSFSAILINIPGDSSAMMSSIDGYPLAQKGKPGKALFTASFSSFIGGTMGVILLTFLGPVLARAGLAFGPFEMLWVIVLGLTSIGWVIGDDPKKGLLATAIGGLLSTVGIAPSTGRVRFVFGQTGLMSGINFVPLVIGAFGLANIIDMVANRQERQPVASKISMKDAFLTKKELVRILPILIRSSILGTFVGLLPGAGATMATFFCYITEKKVGKNKEEMGKGCIEGIAAPESANNAAAMGAFAPMLSLGVPGSSTTAVLMGGLMMWGLTPGPLLFQTEPGFCWGLIASMYIGNIICFLIALLSIPLLLRVIKVPQSILIPVVTVICLIGSYSVRGNMFDVGLMIVIGVLAYLMKKAELPTAPMVLAFVLVPLLEFNISAGVGLANGDVLQFVGSPLSIILFLVVISFITAPKVIQVVHKARNKKK